jgi:hypothetical protein
MMRASLATIFGAATLGAGHAHADEPSEPVRTLPCRPTIACTADLVPPGAFEIELGGQYRALAGEQRQWATPLLTKLTVARWLQLQVGTNGWVVGRSLGAESHYLDGVSVVAKAHFIDQQRFVPSLSASVELGLPTAVGVGASPTTNVGLIAYITKDFGPLHADLNLGDALLPSAQGAQHQWQGALAISTAFGRSPFGAMVELYAFADAQPAAPRDGGVLMAVSHSPHESLMFDFGLDVGLFPTTRALTTFVGMSIVPAKLW